MKSVEDALKHADAVVLSWHGVLFDRDRRAIHDAVRVTFNQWSVEVRDDELVSTRGPTGRPQIERLLAVPRIAAQFRSVHLRWPLSGDIDAMSRNLEPRLLAAAEIASEPNADACDAIRRLHAKGVRTAVICCTPRRLLGPQLAALERAQVPLAAIITADEACDPAPAPWGVFEVMQQLGINDASHLALIDDSPPGATAARNAGACGIALEVAGAASSSEASAILRSLRDIA